MQYLILHWFKWQAGRSARKVLVANYTANEIEGILTSYWQRYLVLKRDLEPSGTLGGDVMVHLAAMSTAFYRELRTRGENDMATTELFYSIAWKIYRKMGRLSWMIAGWRHRDPTARLVVATTLFRTFPFSGPSYEWQDRPSPRNAVAFDCLRCPVADHFKTQGLSEFCARTWCALDRPLAKLWDGELVRTGSIAEGATKCDFKFISNAQEQTNVS